MASNQGLHCVCVCVCVLWGCGGGGGGEYTVFTLSVHPSICLSICCILVYVSYLAK